MSMRIEAAHTRATEWRLYDRAVADELIAKQRIAAGPGDVASILLTRYNIPVGWATGARRGVNLDQEWLERRKELFDRYCLPSVRAQTSSDFAWFVLFDPRTPSRYYEYLDDVATVVFATSGSDASAQISAWLGNSHYRFCVSTRLDNDDAIAIDHLASARQLAQAVVACKSTLGLPFILNFRSGLDVEVGTGIVYRREYPRSSFFSLVAQVEPDGGTQLASQQHHIRVFDQLQSMNITTSEPMWAIVVHEINQGNIVKGQPVDGHPGRLLAARFGIEAQAAA